MIGGLLTAFFTYAPGCLTCCAFGCSGCNSEVGTGGILFFSSFGRLAMIACMIATCAYIQPVLATVNENQESLQNYNILVGCIDSYSEPDMSYLNLVIDTQLDYVSTANTLIIIGIIVWFLECCCLSCCVLAAKNGGFSNIRNCRCRCDGSCNTYDVKKELVIFIENYKKYN